MKSCWILLIVIFTYSCSLGQEQKCYRTLRFSHLKSKLDSSICIPKECQIIDIYTQVDLNNDGLDDKVVHWQPINLVDGDSIYHSIYLGTNGGKWILFEHLSNLEPLYFRNYDFASKTGNKLYDSIKSNYTYPTLSEVEFQKNSINIKFYTDAATIKKLFFTYSVKQKTWLLTREVQWFVPTRYEDDQKMEYDRVVKTTIRIEDFDMLKYLSGDY